MLMRSNMKNIITLDLANVHGGQQNQSTPRYYPQCPVNPPPVVRATPPGFDGRSVTERVNDAYDRAMGPWQVFNGLFGGFSPSAPRPNLTPIPQRPAYTQR